MNLVDILARELKEWPMGWPSLGQASDGSLHREPFLGGHTEYRLTLAEDYISAEVSYIQWQEARNSLIKFASDWNGEGLPPVGIEIEWESDYGWLGGKVVGHDQTVTIVRHNCGYSGIHPHRVRPIRTPEQIAAEERDAACRQMCIDAGGRICDSQMALAYMLYDQGYRKQPDA